MSNHHSLRRSVIRLITFIAFLAAAPTLLAQPGLTKDGQRLKRLPQIKVVKSPQSTPGGMAKLLPLQTFTVEGSFFHDLRTKNKIHLKGTNAWSMSAVVATVIPISATTTALTAQIPALEKNHNYAYYLAVEVEGTGTSEWLRVELGEMNITGAVGTPHIRSISPGEAQQGDFVTLEGFFRGVPRVFFYPTTPGGSPFSLAPSHHGQRWITFKVPPELAPGGYKISVGAENAPGLTKTVRFRVILNPDFKYVLEIDRIKCLKESADGPGADEIYVTAISFRVSDRDIGNSNSWHIALAEPVEVASKVHNNVDAGEYRQETLQLRKFDQASGPIDYLILVGLHEADNGPGYFGKGELEWGMSLIKGTGELIRRSAWPGGELFETNPSREKLAAFAKTMMLMAIVNNSQGDELLGLEELRITQTDMQKLKQLNGVPIMKQLIFKGDDSLYVVDFRFRMEK